MKYRSGNYLLASLVLLIMSSSAQALTCVAGNWQGMVNSSGGVTSCTSGSDKTNPDEDLVHAGLVASGAGVSTDEVTKVSEQEANTGGGSIFPVSVSNGSWGQIPVGGNWAINDDFWMTYDRAAISIKGGSYYTIFYLPKSASGITSGDWSISWVVDESGDGGGISNIKLWGINKIPEPSIIALFGLGFAGLVFVRRKKVARSKK
jgi:hypothetical protein